MSTTPRKTTEARLRRIALRRGLVLTKSRRRDPAAVDYDRFQLHRVAGKVSRQWLTLDEVEARLEVEP